MDIRLKFAFSLSLSFHLILVGYSLFFAKAIDNETIFIEITKNREIHSITNEQTLQNNELKKTKNTKDTKISKKQSKKNRDTNNLLSGFKTSSTKNKTVDREEELTEGRSIKYKESGKNPKNEFLSKKIEVEKERKIVFDEEKKNPLWKHGKPKREILFDPPLHFPSSVKNIGVSAIVKIRAKVDPSGKVFGVEFIQRSGFSLLDISVSKQIRSMRFEKDEKNENS
ncbi:MAG: hypothetical protein HUU45_10500, partial [Leptospiraceae bacterium]|nr:hypothetical protein [Leptospiraceae bacterium]